MKNRETYKQARARLLDELKAKGWETAPTLKTPWAKRDDLRLDFHPQAVYKNGHSMFIDIRGMSLESFIWLVCPAGRIDPSPAYNLTMSAFGVIREDKDA